MQQVTLKSNGAPTSGNVRIDFCAVYFIRNDQFKVSPKIIEKKIDGNAIKLTDDLQEYFNDVIEKTKESTGAVQIHFKRQKDGSQQNDVRDQIRTIAFGDSGSREKVTKELASRLTSCTDKRSQKGLFVVLVRKEGSKEQEYAVYLLLFGSDKPIQAKGHPGASISLKLTKDAFSRQSRHYKTAYFKGKKTSSSFWEGVIEDNQAKKNDVAAFWMTKFLNCDFLVDSRQGTQILVQATKKILSEIENQKEKIDMIGSISALSARGGTISFKNIVENVIPLKSKESFQNALPVESTSYNQPFEISKKSLERKLKIKLTVQLEGKNGETVQVLGNEEVLKDIIRTRKNSKTIDIHFRGTLIDTKI